MARPGDVPVPAMPFDGHPRPGWMAPHGRLVVGLERLPQSAYVWDDIDPDVVWDDPDPDRFVWDAPFVGEGFSDAWCDMTSLELVNGEPDGDDSYRTAYARIELRDPGDGRYATRTVDGRLVFFAPGRRVAVYWLDEDDVGWWLFGGTVATWRQGLDRAVVIEAYGPQSILARELGRDWTAGDPSDLPGERALSIFATAGYGGPSRLDLGDIPLSVPPAAQALPLDVLRRTYRSDGGIVYDDADGAVVARDRRWRDGRADQTRIPTLTSNVCELPGAVVVWEPVAADVDLRLAGTVELTNVAGLTADATGSAFVDPTIVFRHPDPDLWQSQGDGDALAAHIATVRSDARMALASAAVYLHDARFDYWHDVLELRLGDVVRFQHVDRWTDPDRIDTYDLELVVTTLRHRITASEWVVELATSPAVTYTAVELWDVTALVWDDPNPLAVWR